MVVGAEAAPLEHPHRHYQTSSGAVSGMCVFEGHDTLVQNCRNAIDIQVSCALGPFIMGSLWGPEQISIIGQIDLF